MTNDMKKIAYISLAALALLACQREVDFQEEVIPTYTVTIQAGFQDETKTAYSDQGAFSWAAGDKIGVLVTNGTETRQVAFSTTDAKPVATFTGEVPEGFTVADYASYPFTGIKDGEVCNDLVYDAAKQGWTLSGSIRPDAEKPLAGIPLVGTKDVNGFFQFKTAVGIVKFTVENVPSATVFAELKAAEPATLSGIYAVNNGAALAMDKGVEAVATARNFSAPAEKNTTMDFYFFVPAGNLPVGTEFTLRSSAEGEALAFRAFRQPVDVAANRIVNIAPIALEPEPLFSRQLDSLTLVAIYNASDGANWAKNKWDLSKPMTEWPAVTLNEDGRVSALKLSTSGVITKEWTLPAEISNLTELTDLRINSNKLTGNIPDEVYDLAKLQYLYFQNDNITGALSPKLGQLTELTELYVDRNANMTGGIPKEIGNLKKLSRINISQSGIGGEIPAELGQCESLLQFMAFKTNLSGELPDIWDMPVLQTVMLHTNPGLTGNLPNSLSKLKPIVKGTTVTAPSLQLYGCSFTGTIPDSFAELHEKTKQVYVEKNKMSGVISLAVQAHPNFSSWRYDPQQEGYGLTLEEVNYRQVDSLALVAVYNASDGANWAKNKWDLSKPMTEWPAVTLNEDGRVSALKLSTSGVITKEWTLPAEIGNLTELTDLRINSNKLTGEIPETVYDLVKLEYLYFQNDNLTGALSPKLGQLTELIQLYVDRNTNMTGGIPKEIGNLKKLERINISQSGIGGEIPAELGQCESLLQFMAYNTKISGELPDIWDMPVLQTVMLHTNPGLTGNLPNSLSKLKSLSSGTAPSLQLYGCNFTGNIPESFANLPAKTTQVQVQNNRMSGVIPAAVQAHANFSKWKYDPQQEGYGLTLE
jgi:Leucine-rich repeat (LRR) protein